MKEFMLQVSFELDGVARIQRTTNICTLRLKCTNCGEEHQAHVVVDPREEHELMGRGTAHMAMKCGFCGRLGSANILDPERTAPSITENEKLTGIMKLEFRGYEPVEWIPENMFFEVESEGGQVWKDVAITSDEPEWCEYDEDADMPVTVTLGEHRFERV